VSVPVLPIGSVDADTCSACGCSNSCVEKIGSKQGDLSFSFPSHLLPTSRCGVGVGSRCCFFQSVEKSFASHHASNAAIARRVTGPILPPPTGTPSSFTTGNTRLLAAVIHTSLARCSSAVVTSRSVTASGVDARASMRAPRVIPSRMPSLGVTMRPSTTAKTFETVPS